MRGRGACRGPVAFQLFARVPSIAGEFVVPHTNDAPQKVIPLGIYLEGIKRQGILISSVGVESCREVRFATDDSRSVVDDTLFVCKGAAFKRDYLLSAIDAGAVSYVSEVDYGVDVPCILVSDIRIALGVLADIAYGHPSGSVSVCAFTGTKGKTTSVYYLKGILDAQASLDGVHPAAVLSSILLDDGVHSGISKLTTPEAFELERHFANAAAVGCKHVVMEASSQALKYKRTFGVEFAAGVFTNIGEDHISPIEHPDFEDYFSSKLKLFDSCRVAVVNLDMDHAERVLEAAKVCERTLTYSLADDAADVYCEKIEHGGDGIRATVRTPSFTREVLIPTPVTFNVANALGAIAAAEAMGLDEEAIVRGFKDVRVPGRMELYPTEGGSILGVVDFAHNGMSLETMLLDLRESYPDRELVVVFGATGGKGVDRRETMGSAAGKYADRIVITEDDPGPEDPADICDAIARAAKAEGLDRMRIVLDREEAIRTAVRETERPAIVIVTGKGHETRMLRRKGAEPCEADGVMLRRALDDFESGVI